MAIIEKSCGYASTPNYTKEHFARRVLRVEEGPEYRNCSDTMDYSDWQTVRATWALVWLGTHGVPPREFNSKPVSYPSHASWEGARDLEAHEQFAWVDCSNVFSWRYGYTLTAEVDTNPSDDPAVWEALSVWEKHQAEIRAEKLRKSEEVRLAREAAEAKEAEKKAAREAKKAAREVAQKAEAENLLRRVPQKGSKVTVQGVSGTIAWMGVTKHYGKFNARVGVRPEKGGEMIWVDAKEVAQEALTAWERL